LPQISAFYGIRIYMYFDDHSPPHFHADYAEYSMQMAIGTLEVMDGRLPARQLRLVRQWAAMRRAELLENWEIGHSPFGIMKHVEPLQ
jgi:hypothetical protein